MRFSLFGLAALAAVLVGGLAADGQTLRQRQTIAEQERRLEAEEASPTRRACGTAALAASFDWSGFQLDDLQRHSAYGYCGAALSAIRGLCADPTARSTLTTKVNRVVCRFGGAGQRALSLNGNVLTYSIDWDAANSEDFVKDWLLDNL
jgi:hypothetical protein